MGSSVGSQDRWRCRRTWPDETEPCIAGVVGSYMRQCGAAGHTWGVATMGKTKARHVERLAGNLLRVARDEAEMSQRDLAEAAHVTESVIAEIKSGPLQPSLPDLA